MKKALFGLAFIGALVGGAVVLNMGEVTDKKKLDRAARVPCDKIVKEDCPGGVFTEDKYCLCLTNKKEGDLPDEVTTVPVGKAQRMDVCQVVDKESGQKHLAVRYPPLLSPIPVGCKQVCPRPEDEQVGILLPAISMHNLESGIEPCLRIVCAPCVITPDSHGPCPECFYRGDCATLCPEVEDGL